MRGSFFCGAKGVFWGEKKLKEGPTTYNETAVSNCTAASHNSAACPRYLATQILFILNALTAGVISVERNCDLGVLWLKKKSISSTYLKNVGKSLGISNEALGTSITQNRPPPLAALRFGSFLAALEQKKIGPVARDGGSRVGRVGVGSWGGGDGELKEVWKGKRWH